VHYTIFSHFFFFRFFYFIFHFVFHFFTSYSISIPLQKRYGSSRTCLYFPLISEKIAEGFRSSRICLYFPLKPGSLPQRTKTADSEYFHGEHFHKDNHTCRSVFSIVNQCDSV